MQKVTMYGKGAVQILHGKETLSAVDGQISVPPELVGRMEELGYSTAQRGGDEPEGEPMAKIEAPTDVALTGGDPIIGAEAERQKRLEGLLAEGLSEDEARQIIDAEAAPLPPLE